MNQYKSAIEKELKDNILQFWLKYTIDKESGGFYGYISYDNQVKRFAPKGAVLNARILWTFAEAYQHFKQPEYLQAAKRAFDYIRQYFIDEEYGGVYWMVDHQGNPLETKKQVYAVAFTIYAFAAYYKATNDNTALMDALTLFNDLEKYAFDSIKGGYYEAFSREWELLEDLRLSDKDANEAKTMNTHLHVLEAYTTLYEVSKDRQVKRQLEHLIALFEEKIINENAHFNLFFDENWVLKSSAVSYGHDIEGSWLLEEAARALEDQPTLERIRKTSLKMASVTLEEGLDQNGAVLNELHGDGTLDDELHWWPQAEGTVGFLNAYQLSSDPKYLDAAFRLWDFIQGRLINKEYGEWYWRVDANGIPNLNDEKVGPWKCPYHNGRACLELLYRIKQLEDISQTSAQ
ncbi:AGE family epimerase/isomerase [Limibacter armeniacum]|uniref:AGE family epimerase/isomerase n=1 Tax=Limibacter armeniacum TaxID=466084 RepID=UPI002FE564D9